MYLPYSTLSKRTTLQRQAINRGNARSIMKGFRKRSNNQPDYLALFVLLIMSCSIRKFTNSAVSAITVQYSTVRRAIVGS